MYERTYYFDAAAIGVLLPLFVAIITKKLYKNASSKVFIAVLISSFCCAIFDILSCFPNELGSSVTWFTTTFYFIFRAVMPLLYLIYLLVLTDSVSKLNKKKILWVFTVLPYVIVLIMILISRPTGLIFNIVNENGNVVYQRGPSIWVVYVTSIIYILFCLFYIIKYHKFFNVHQFVSLIAIVPISAASVLLQYFFPWLLVEVFSSVLALVLASLSIEAPDELVDNKTGLLSSKQFYTYIKRGYIMHKEYYIILVNFRNYAEIYNVFNYDASTKYVRDLATMINTHYRSITKTYKTYFLEDGLFAISVNSKEAAKLLADNLEMELVGLKRTGYTPKYDICFIDVTNDFSDVSSLVVFINNFHNEKMFDERLVDISKIKNDRSFIIKNNIGNVIDDGLKNKEFEVYYQPIYNVREKKFRSAEALIRLNSTKYGFIVPGLFINHAEKNGKIIQIDNFVFDEVFNFISSNEFKELGLEYIEINLSMIDCSDKDLFERLKKLMEKYNINSKSINLEITESIDVDYSRIDHNIKKLCSLGISFSLDDYGTGFSNIERFTTLPLDIVKIDKTLADKYKEESMEHVLKNTFRMINDLNRKTVVEGVEEKEQAEAFINYGCDYIQGYYYSKPLPKDKFIEFIKINNN